MHHLTLEHFVSDFQVGSQKRKDLIDRFLLEVVVSLSFGFIALSDVNLNLLAFFERKVNLICKFLLQFISISNLVTFYSDFFSL